MQFLDDDCTLYRRISITLVRACKIIKRTFKMHHKCIRFGTRKYP